MVASAKLNVTSLAELAALSKEKRGTLSYALAIPMQIMMDRGMEQTGADIVSVPARGGGDIVNGLLTGTAPVAIAGLPNFIEYIRAGTVKARAVDSEARSSLFPDVPTLAELGFTNLAPVYFGFVAPPGTSNEAVQTLYKLISTIGDDSDFRRKRLLDLGLMPVFDEPGQFADYLERQRKNSKRLVEESGFQAR